MRKASVQGATRMEDLRRLLGELEKNLKVEWLCSSFVREPLLVKNCFNPVGTEVAAVPLVGSNDDMTLREADQHPGALSAPCSHPPCHSV